MISFFKIDFNTLKAVLGRLDFVLFFVVLFSLPFGKSIFVPLLFGWLCAVLLSYLVKRDYSVDRFKGLLILPILLYLLHIIGVAQSTNLEGGFFDMQMKLSLLLLPLLYPYQRESYKSNWRNFLWIFVAGCAVASLYYFGYAAYRSCSVVDGLLAFNPIPKYGWNNYFLSTEFSYLIHPSYLALYLLVALLIIGVELSRLWKRRARIKIAVTFFTLFLVSALIMLESRAGILGFCLLAFVWLLYLVFAKQRYIVGVGVLVALFGLTYFVFTKFDRLANTAKSLQTTAVAGIKNQSKEDGTAIRFWIWKSALSVVKEHPVWGVGTGDVRDELQKQYESKGMAISAQYRHNAHDQYLETWLGVGVFGLMALLAMFIAPLWVGIKRRDWLLVGFICLCSVSFMFESMLNSVMGVGFFAIFYTMLVSRIGFESN
jgi:O-antigen ligase